MKLFLLIAVISFINNLLLTYESYTLMIKNILQVDFLLIIEHSNLIVYFKYIIKEIIYLIFFYTWWFLWREKELVLSLL